MEVELVGECSDSASEHIEMREIALKLGQANTRSLYQVFSQPDQILSFKEVRKINGLKT